MKRNTLLIVLVVVAAFFIFLNPFQLFNRGGQKRPVPAPASLAPVLEYADRAWQSPQDYVLSAFQRHDVVLLGEFFKIHQNVELVHDLIPRLYGAGIRALGIEYALAEDQPEIDAMLTAPAWDESRARAVTFHWLVTWGYQEYIDLYKAAWEVNHARPPGAAPFRIVALNVKQDWEALKTQKDLSDPAVVARIFAHGVPEAFMADAIDREFTRKGQKALVFCGTQHIFTRYRSSSYEKNAADMKLPEVRRMGNIVYSRIGDRVFGISLHSPWPDPSRKSGLTWAANGVLDALVDALPPQKRNGGWDLAGTPMGSIPLGKSPYAEPGRSSALGDLFDGYVLQGPISQYTMVSAIPDFVSPEDAAIAGRQFPGVKPASPPTAAQMNQTIADDLQALGKALAELK
ncbi:MAG TPA: hypothetical protein VMQ10_04210 [Spirochaetia bacterium]|nr:hypothetical protein [Spirochaetia bacterium]